MARLSTDRRLLVLSYHFPPDPAIGGRRWAGYTKHLATLGWRSWVIASGPSSAFCTCEGTEVRHVAKLPTINNLYLRVAHWAPKADAKQGEQPPSHPKVSSEGGVRWIRRELAQVTTVPDEARGWITTAARAARRVISEVRPSVVVSSGPPHSIHLAGWLASRGMECRFLIDVRDPWNKSVKPSWRDHPSGAYVVRWAQCLLHGFVMPRCDGIICTTQRLTEIEQAANPTLPVSWVPNGADLAELPKVERSRHRGLSLTHAGTIYGGRSIDPALMAFASYLDECPGDRELGARIHLLGNIEDATAQRIRMTAAACGVGKHLQLSGIRSREETLRILACSHVGLVLAQDQPLQVPAKLYELAAIGLDVLAITERDSATWRECQRLGLHVAEPTDHAGLVAILCKIRQTPNQGPSQQVLAAVDYQSLSTLMDRVLRWEKGSLRDVTK